MHVAASSLIVSIILSAPAHPVPDGVIYRGIQLVVRPDRVEVRYQLGLNENMVREELANQFGIQKAADSNPVDDLLEIRDRLFPVLPKRIKATVDDVPVALELIRADVVRQQHAQLEFAYHMKIAASVQPKRLVVEDQNFPDKPGYHLMAIKSRGKVDVLQQGEDGEALLARMQRALTDDGAATTEVTPIRRVEAYFATPATYESNPSQAPEPQPQSSAAPRDEADGGLTETAEETGRDEPTRPAADSPESRLPPGNASNEAIISRLPPFACWTLTAVLGLAALVLVTVRLRQR